MTVTTPILEELLLSGRPSPRIREAHPKVSALRNGDRTEDAMNLAGLLLINEDLSGIDLSHCNLTGTNLTGANLEGARLIGANLTGAILHSANLDRAELLNANLQDADLTECSGKNVGLGHTNMRGARLLQASLEGATLVAADLTGADLRASVFDKVNGRDVILKNVEATASSWVHADLTGAQFDDSSFERANMQHSRLCNVRGYISAQWIDADIRDVYFGGAHLLRRHILDENYLHSFRRESARNEWIYRLWWLTSDCGRSFVRWGLCTLAITVLFSIVYCFVQVDFGPNATSLSPLYYSVVTVTTLGYGDVLPISMAAQIASMTEVVIGYLMLGGVLSIFAQKMARRSE